MNKMGMREIQGRAPGPTSVVMAGVHGDEKCGLEAFDQLLPRLDIRCGRVLFICGNPRAIKQHKRFTGADLNRMFKDDEYISSRDKKSYEYRRAQFLKPWLAQADAMLDLHASSNPQSQPFLICEKNARQIVRHLPFRLVVTGFDIVEPGGTDYYMNSRGQIGICAECGYAEDSDSTDVALAAIKAFLITRGHIPGKKKSYKQRWINMYHLYLTHSEHFELARAFSDFEKVENEELIGKDGATEIRAPKESVILFPQNCNKKGAEAFLLGK